MQANTNTLTIYDPAMCCSTGVCGPEVDPKLVRFSADLDWLSKQGVEVRRFNLAQEPGAFTEDVSVKAVLDSQGDAGLPLIKLGDAVVSIGNYPSRDELARWVGLGVAETEKSGGSGCCGPAKERSLETCREFGLLRTCRLEIRR